MERNFEIGHLGNEDGVALLLAAPLPTDQKLEILKSWKKCAWTDPDNGVLESALEGRAISCGTFLQEYNTILFHLLVCYAKFGEMAPDDISRNLFIGSPTFLNGSKHHPLFNSSVKLA